MRPLPFMIASVLLAAFLARSLLFAGESRIDETMVLPPPQRTGGMPLMEALSNRHSSRNFNLDRELSDQELSNLLWATWGVNRQNDKRTAPTAWSVNQPDGRRTAPTAKNTQNVGVCVVLSSGVWWYNGAKNTLELALNVDARARFDGAPVTLVYFAPADDPAGGMHVGSLYQNAGLYCASAGLANVVKSTGANALDGKLSLPQGYRVYVFQSIGYPD